MNPITVIAIEKRNQLFFSVNAKYRLNLSNKGPQVILTLITSVGID